MSSTTDWTSTYARLPDSELVHLARGGSSDFRPDAWAALEAEMRKRGLSPAEGGLPPAPSGALASDVPPNSGRQTRDGPIAQDAATSRNASYIRAAAGILAFIVWSLARSILLESRKSGDNLLEGPVLGWVLHLVAASMVLTVFFISTQTRVRSRIPTPDTRTTSHGSQLYSANLTQRENQSVRERLVLVLYMSGGLLVILIAALLADLPAGVSIAHALNVLYDPVDVTVDLVLASALFASGYGAQTRRRWAFRTINVLGLFTSVIFPLGVMQAIYCWWAVRSLDQGSALPPSPPHRSHAPHRTPAD